MPTTALESNSGRPPPVATCRRARSHSIGDPHPKPRIPRRRMPGRRAAYDRQQGRVASKS